MWIAFKEKNEQSYVWMKIKLSALDRNKNKRGWIRNKNNSNNNDDKKNIYEGENSEKEKSCTLWAKTERKRSMLKGTIIYQKQFIIIVGETLKVSQVLLDWILMNETVRNS